MLPPEGCPLKSYEWEAALATFAGGKLFTSRQAGARLYMNPSTVRSHLSSGRRRLRCPDNEHYRRRLIDCGWMGEKGGPRQARGGNEAGALSPGWKAYLHAFDVLLAQWRDERAVAKAREVMRYHLAGACIAQGLPPELLRGNARARYNRPMRMNLPEALIPGL